MTTENTEQSQVSGPPELSDVFGGFVDGAWVADFIDSDRPRIAQVKEVYEMSGEVLLDLVFYERDGTRIGRVSPACGGQETSSQHAQRMRGA